MRHIERSGNYAQFRPMLPHPPTEEISLPAVLAVLGDATRLAILGELARHEGKVLPCAHFLPLTSKSNLSYHVAKMREAGIVRVEPRGTARLISLRRADLDARFPGLLDSIVATAVTMPLGPEDRSSPQAVEGVR